MFIFYQKLDITPKLVAFGQKLKTTGIRHPNLPNFLDYYWITKRTLPSTGRYEPEKKPSIYRRVRT